MKKNILTNHITFCLDRSGSVSYLIKDIIGVYDNQIASLKQQAKATNQETRVSVYTFASQVECLAFDVDIKNAPTLNYSNYYASGQTALIDATAKAITDLSDIPQKTGDHSFLIYVLTDGQENNSSRYSSFDLNRMITSLKDNWTLGVLVPDFRGEADAKKYGFPAGNIKIWNVSKEGLQEVDREITASTQTYYAGRAKGIVGTRSLFTANIKSKPSEIKRKLDELSSSEYTILQTAKDEVIREFVERKIGEYVKGNSYYQLIKPETIQPYKEVIVQDRTSNKMYAGDNARKVLGLPDYELKVKPGNFKNWDVFINSTSINRKLPAGSKLVVLV